MKSRLNLAISLFIVTVAAAVASAGAQTSPVVDKPSAPPDLALTYSYIRSNAPPAGCGCFNLNGGSATFAWPISSGRFAIVGDVTAATAPNIANSGAGLTLGTFTGGVRYKPQVGRSSLHPFGQVLVGVAHSSGPFVQGQYSATNNANAAFAANMGGGLEQALFSAPARGGLPAHDLRQLTQQSPEQPQLERWDYSPNRAQVAR